MQNIHHKRLPNIMTSRLHIWEFMIVLMLILISLNLIACSKEKSIFHDAKGNRIDLSNENGKWIIINYWASWCHSCVQEIPELNKFYKENKNKNILILAVNYDGLQGNVLAQAIRNTKIQFPVLIENPNLFFKFPISDVVPVTYIINPHGKLVAQLLGPQTETQLKKIIQ